MESVWNRDGIRMAKKSTSGKVNGANGAFVKHSQFTNQLDTKRRKTLLPSSSPIEKNGDLPTVRVFNYTCLIRRVADIPIPLIDIDELIEQQSGLAGSAQFLRRTGASSLSLLQVSTID